MRLTTRQNSIVSYAGLDADALWAGARRAFSQADGPVPARFLSFLPIFPAELIVNMSYVGAGARMASPMGFSTDPVEYHRALCEEMPDLYVGDNYRRCFDYEGRFKGGVVTVDAAWAMRFPQYRPFQGEKLMIHMIGGGHQAVAVPESVFPRGGGVLENAERELRVTARCEHFGEYARRRIVMGERYDPARFGEDYLRQFDLAGVCIRQRELSRVMQDLCILRGLQEDGEAGAAMFTESALRAGGVRQYVPWRCACDTFEPEPVTRATARLMQLYFEEDDPVGDLWLPYQNASEYIDRQRMALDVRALCEGFQIAPAYDAATHGGRYPTRVRVVVVRDRDIRPMVADTLNNPAYGSGMGPLGMLNKLVFLPDSRELLRQKRLVPEEIAVTAENASVDADAYRRMCELAALQEWKGRLLDALYRRESALAQMQPGTPAYERVDALLTGRVDALEKQVERAAKGQSCGQLSGYDADIGYLRRMQRHREGVPEDEPDPMPFSPDSLRELCIESGYAMRGSVRRFSLDELALPQDEAGEDAEETAAPGEGALADEAAAPDEASAPDEGGDVPAGAASAPEGAAPDNAPQISEPPETSAKPSRPSDEPAAPAARISHAAKVRQNRKKKKQQSKLRFEQIDMFGGAKRLDGNGEPYKAQPTQEPQAGPQPQPEPQAAQADAQPSAQPQAQTSAQPSAQPQPQPQTAPHPTSEAHAPEAEALTQEPQATPAPQPAPEAEPSPSQPEPSSSPSPYVRRSLSELTGAPVKAELGKMARLLQSKADDSSNL